MTQVIVGSNRAELVEQIAQYVLGVFEQTKDKLSVAISGGSLPSLLAENLKKEPYRSKIDWGKWHVWFVDERYVAPDHNDSNFKECSAHLFSAVPIPANQIYQINHNIPLTECAEDYAKRLGKFFETDQLPKFDLILLGMGPDGHCASLFPGHALLQEKKLLIASISDSPKPPPERITFTLPLINNATNVAFIATGAAKKEPLESILNTPGCSLPSAQVKPSSGNLKWFVDRDAVQGVNIPHKI